MNLEENVRDLIANNQFDATFKQLFHFFNELKKENADRYKSVQGHHDDLTVLSSQFYHTEHKDKMGISPQEAGQIDRNRVAVGLLAVLDACKSELDLIYSDIPLPEYSNGIIEKKTLTGYPKRLPDENFAAELLTNQILLKKTKTGELQIRINRGDVREYVISNAGKKYLNQKHVAGRKEELLARDQEIHDFVLNAPAGKAHVIDLKGMDLPLRWLSGGAISIVEWKKKKWVPFFFRDIEPYGWNISLGGSERHFQEDIDEYQKPWHMIVREFIEETLILDREPEMGSSPRVKRFYFGDLYTENQTLNLNRFANEHIQLRNKFDFLNLLVDEKKVDLNLDINIQTLPTKSVLKIVPEKGETTLATGILMSINLLEFGLEVVKVLTFRMENDDYLLDGEILDRPDGTKELVRMPCALIDLEFFRKYLAGKQLSYTDANSPSVQLEIGNIPPEYIHVFDWDVKRRWDIFQDESAPGGERERYQKWAENFGPNFQIGTGGDVDTNHFPALFTPTSAKILQYYLAGEWS
ncbi:MAG: hypothetical protein H6563_10935 [Lewinellaceae bacterium]|nr:hypothetical protein [Lewinellaceae bacterium]